MSQRIYRPTQYELRITTAANTAVVEWSDNKDAAAIHTLNVPCGSPAFAAAARVVAKARTGVSFTMDQTSYRMWMDQTAEPRELADWREKFSVPVAEMDPGQVEDAIAATVYQH